MDKSKSQLVIRFAVLTVLSLAIAFCAVYYFFLRDSLPVDGQNPDPGNTLPLTTVIPRDPRFLGADTAWETNIGGSGEDEIIEVLYNGANYYIFGNSDSTDGDIISKKRDMFMAVVSSSGVLMRVTVFGTEYDDSIVCARMFNDGFLVLSDSTKTNGDVILYHINSKFEVNSVEIGGPLIENGLELLYSDGEIAVLTVAIDGIIGKKSFTLTALNTSLKVTWAKAVSRAASLKFAAMYKIGSQYTIIGEATETLSTFPTLATVSKDKNALFSDIQKHTVNSEVLAVVPYTNGYMLSVRQSSGAVLLRISYAHLLISYETMMPSKPLFSTFTPMYDGSVLLSILGDEVKTWLFNLDGSKMKEVDTLSGKLILDSIGTPELNILLMTDAGNIKIMSFSSSFDKLYEQSFGGTRAESAVAIHKCENGVAVFGNSSSSDGSVGKNFGKTDAWCFAVN